METTISRKKGSDGTESTIEKLLSDPKVQPAEHCDAWRWKALGSDVDALHTTDRPCALATIMTAPPEADAIEAATTRQERLHSAFSDMERLGAGDADTLPPLSDWLTQYQQLHSTSPA